MSIENFDKVMAEYQDAFTSAATPKEQDAVDKKFGKLIDKAEEELEASFDAELKAADEALAKEQKEAELVNEEPDDEKDEFDPKAGEPMRSDALALTQAEFKKKYKVKDIQVLAESIGVETRAGGKYKREATLVADIYKAL